jgi:phage tail-like protein
MSLDLRTDPVLAFNFHIALTDSTAGTGKLVTTIALQPLIANPLAGFSECSGLEMTLETEDYPEGGNNGRVLKFPKRTKYGEIVLKKGLTRRTDLFDWCYGFTQGIAKRKDGVITLRDAAGHPFMVWGFQRGLPTKYSGPTLNAGQSAVAIETLTIAHEGLFQLAGAAGLAAAVRGAASAIAKLF